MQDYQGNSKSQKEGKDANKVLPEKNLEKVVTGDVVVKQPGIGTKFKRIFFGGDMNTASQYVVSEVLVPALRNMLNDVISRGTDRLIYGDSKPRNRPPSYTSRVQYNNPIYRQEPARRYLPDQRPIDRWSQGSKTFDDIVVATKADADIVVERLTDIVDVYETVSVADLHELVGLPSSHIDHKWGWTQLRNIEVRQTRDGYKISLPPLEEIS